MSPSMSAFLLFYFDQFPFVKALTVAHLFNDAWGLSLSLLFMSREYFIWQKKVLNCLLQKAKIKRKFFFIPFVFIRSIFSRVSLSLFEVMSKLNFVVLSTKKNKINNSKSLSFNINSCNWLLNCVPFANFSMLCKLSTKDFWCWQGEGGREVGGWEFRNF